MKQIIETSGTIILVLVIGWYVDSIAHNAIVQAVKVIIVFVTAAAVLAAVGFAAYVTLSIYEKYLTRRARRTLTQREADVMTVVSEQHGVYVRELNPKAVWRPLHLNPTTYQNGRQESASDFESLTWQTFTLRDRPSLLKNIAPQLLPEPEPAPVDLLTALDSAQRCLIVGASDSGKTTLLQWIVHRRAQTSNVIVIDPHSWPDKWPGCKVIGNGRNYDEINRALSALIQIMGKRYEEIGRGVIVEGMHPRLTILIDEWRAIVFNLGKPASEAIKGLLTESRKAAFSVFVATHSDRAKPLGLEGEYDLKDGFSIVRLSIANGVRQASLDTGKGELPATLPGPFTGGGVVMETDDYINLEVEPNPIEAGVLTLYEQGKNNKKICEAMGWTPGGKQYQRIDQIIAKFN